MLVFASSVSLFLCSIISALVVFAASPASALVEKSDSSSSPQLPFRVKPGREKPPSVQIKSYGVYELLETEQRLVSADTTAGYSSVINARLLAQTSDIVLKPNQVFGIDYEIDDSASSTEWIAVTIEISHPHTINYYGRDTNGFTLQSAARRGMDGRYRNSALYVLSEPYELVPGNWEIRVIYRGNTEVSQRFTLSAR